LIKVEAFPYMDHAVVRIIGTCTGSSHEPPTCPGHSLITRVSASELEALGVTRSICQAVAAGLEGNPELEGLLMH
jgi:hypothetical protein